MNNKDYLKFYNFILTTINQYNAGDCFQLIKILRQKPELQYFVKLGYNGELMTQTIVRLVRNLAIDDLIVAKSQPMAFLGNNYIIQGLTTKGHNYLAVINEPKAWRKVKQALHDEGIPLTPQSASRFMTKLFF